jgi:hypothetical protein
MAYVLGLNRMNKKGTPEKKARKLAKYEPVPKSILCQNGVIDHFQYN